MKRTYLAGLGWVEEKNQPKGIRLRWSYPFQGIDKAGGYLGFPESIIVERVKLGRMHIDDKEEKDNFFAPEDWWDKHADIDFSSQIFPDNEIRSNRVFEESVQGVKFTYISSFNNQKVHIKTYDSNDDVIDNHIVNDNDKVIIYGSDIKKIEIISLDGFSWSGKKLKNFKTLNMFKNHITTGWEKIAKISVKKTIHSNLSKISPRYGETTIGEEDWSEFIDLANQVQNLNPNDLDDEEIPKWDQLSLLMSVRWEFGVLFGQGFYDGSRDHFSDIDMYNKDKILQNPDGEFYAYRVYEEEDRGVGHSNIFICRAQKIDALSMPNALMLDQCKAELESDTKNFTATYHLECSHTCNGATGIEIEEESSGSATFGTTGKNERYFNQNKIVNFKTTLEHSRDISFHDEKIRCRVRAVDWWDRTSDYTSWTSWKNLSFKHIPEVPLLESVKYASDGNVILLRKDDFLWEPDIIVKHDVTAKILVYRQKMGEYGKAKSQSVTVSDPELIEIEENGVAHYKIVISENLDLTKFKNGFLSQPSSSFKIKVQHISGKNIYFKINNNENLCQSGIAKLQQDFNHLDLWKEVAEFDPNNLPSEMNFYDFVPAPTQKSDVLSYQLRLSCLGEIGLASNIVQDFRMPVIPEMPPPFAVTTVGTDFYNRTMVKIKFTNQTDGIYSIWWANGEIDNVTSFKDKATMGDFQDQRVYQQEYLYDLLSLPLYDSDNSVPITIGVRQVNEGGSASEFKIVSFDFKSSAERNLV